MPDASQRFHELDALRGGALLLGVLLHAALSFVPEATWMVKDSDLSWQLLVGVFTVHIFRMSLFFAIAGFFAHMLWQKRGARAFVRNRSVRIALPLVVFLPIVLASLAAVALWAAAYADSGPFAAQPRAEATPNTAAQPQMEAEPNSGAQPQMEAQPDTEAQPQMEVHPAEPAGRRRGVMSFILFNLPLLHLWFLSALLWFYAAALALVSLGRILDKRGRLGAAIDSSLRVLATTHALPFALAVPLGAVFMFYLPWTETGGIPAPESGLVPNLQAVAGYGTAFGFGWFVHRQTTLLRVWQRAWAIYLIVAIALTVYCARTMGSASTDPSFLPSIGSMRYVVLAAYPLAIWAWCLALLGMATRFLSAESKRVRYLSDSSYWIYLVHMPIVGVVQVAVAPWSMGWQLKYPLILVVAIPVLLASYQWFVRGTWLGGWLNGRRYARQ